MLKRELSTPKTHYCISEGRSGSGGDYTGDESNGNSKKTYDLKIIQIGTEIYIDKSPELVCADFRNLIQQRYYIKYAEGNIRMSLDSSDSVIDIPVCYTGPCTSGASAYRRGWVDNNEDAYMLEFSTIDFTIFVPGIGEGNMGRQSMEIRLGKAAESMTLTQYNNEDLGDIYVIWDLSFIWESIDL